MAKRKPREGEYSAKRKPREGEYSAKRKPRSEYSDRDDRSRRDDSGSDGGGLFLAVFLVVIGFVFLIK